VGLLAVSGSPPFGPFVSEFAIVSGAIREDHPWVAAFALLMLALIFVGIARMMLDMTLGNEASSGRLAEAPSREPTWMVVGPMTLACLVLLLGVYVPRPLRDNLARAAATLGGYAP
jgi:hydrogenase-4 component F